MRALPVFPRLLSLCVLVAAVQGANPAPAVTATPAPVGTPTPTPSAGICDLHPVPASGPPGTRVELKGTCGYIHYHRIVSFYFDYTLMAQFDGVAADYQLAITVPHTAQPGMHVLKLSTGWTSDGGVTAPFEVTGEAAACSGDCNRDGDVTVDELTIGVNIALDLQPATACEAVDLDTDSVVTIDELMVAVQSALLGCEPPSSCRDYRECAPPALCLAPGEFPGCGVCLPYDSNCQIDADCTGGICAPVAPQRCPCAPVNVCQPGCQVDADCDEGEACDRTQHCVPAPCLSACPAQFRCELHSTGYECHRILCDRDGACGNGFCVNGQCYATLGTCNVPVP